MSVAIHTAQPTTLTIDTPEITNLEQMGTKKIIGLQQGANKVPVGPGVYRVLSTRSDLRVTADTPDTKIMPFSKDGNGSPDGPKVQLHGFDATSVGWLTSGAMNKPAPE